jgi:tRNA(Ile2) C34 agmatinyltransferase TiaS
MEMNRSTSTLAVRAWARLLAKVYEVDPMMCPKCGGDMK